MDTIANKVEILSNVHAKNLVDWAKDRPEVVVLSGDLTSSCEIKPFKEAYPDRFFSMGVAEQNMLGFAAGLAREGFRPWLHTFAVFFYRRAYDQLAMSVAYPNLPVTLVGFLPGIMTPGGVTHQAIEDVSVLRSLPNMTIIDVGDATEVETILDAVEKVNGPVYIRMLRKDVPRLFDRKEPFEINKARVLSEGTDIALFSSSICTEEAIRATKALKEKGLSIQHLHISTLKPFTDPAVIEALKKVKYGAITLENHTVIGGLGTCVAEVMAENAIGKPLVKLGLNDTFAHGATQHYLMSHYGLDAIALVKGVEKLTGKSYGISEKDLEEIRLEVISTKDPDAL
ncbi:transketolase C-terminal domain-containing protein [Neobacillus sp.]|uniref:transketolase family protein n=1 Tax=Neobacillus sp. TaxID=2675273 RepID=UPI0028985826|nr:transketolase C-terminal domain-containing protein [Neobacillus sp.]